MRSPNRTAYSLLSDKDSPSSEQLISSKQPTVNSGTSSQSVFFWITIINIVFLLSGSLAFLEAARINRNIETEFIKRVSSFSPASTAISYHLRLFNVSSEETAHYQGMPTPNITEAWESITDGVRPMRLPLTMLPLLNTQDDESLVKFLDDDGGGVMASIGVLHQLHCVNLLRKSTYHDYYKNDRFFTVSSEELRGHLDHCIELLRQTVSCAGDVTVITYKWNKGMPHPNFEKVQQCRNFDKILDWAHQQEVHIPRSHMLHNSTVMDNEG